MFKKIIVLTIKFYQNHRPLRCVNLCIYEPSCSQYALMAVEKYGALNGLKLSIKRISRCNNKSTGGEDFLP